MSNKDAKIFKAMSPGHPSSWLNEWKHGELSGSWAHRVDIIHRNVRSLLHVLNSNSSSSSGGSSSGGAGEAGGGTGEAGVEAGDGAGGLGGSSGVA